MKVIDFERVFFGFKFGFFRGFEKGNRKYVVEVL